MRTKLIFFEGIPGSGKSTLARQAARFLQKHSVNNSLYPEGCLQPANLDGYVLLPLALLPDLFARFPRQETKLRTHMSEKDGYTLIQRQKAFRENSAVFRYLQPYSVWDGGLNFELFAQLHRDSWAAFAANLRQQEQTAIFDCAFLQDHITELLLIYEKSEADILGYFRKLTKIIQDLHPFIFYLRQTDVDETIRRAAAQRTREPGGGSWAERVAGYIANSPYGKTHRLVGYEGMADFFKRRRELDLLVLDSLDIGHAVIGNDRYDWPEVQERVTGILRQVIVSTFAPINAL